jgi:hypothetical protein
MHIDCNLLAKFFKLNRPGKQKKLLGNAVTALKLLKKISLQLHHKFQRFGALALLWALPCPQLTWSQPVSFFGLSNEEYFPMYCKLVINTIGPSPHNIIACEATSVDKIIYN